MKIAKGMAGMPAGLGLDPEDLEAMNEGRPVMLDLSELAKWTEVGKVALFLREPTNPKQWHTLKKLDLSDEKTK